MERWESVVELKIHTAGSAPEGSRPVLDGIRADLGLVPNFAAAIAESPVLVTAFDGMRRAVAAMDPRDREVAGVATGVAVDNHYGVAFHSTVLAGLGVGEDDLDRMRAGSAPADPRLAAVYEFARQFVAGRGKVDAGTLDRLTAQGLSTAQILDVVAECAFGSLVGAVDNLAGRIELDPFLKPREWKPAG
jgi:alkylhydroperoxidase family enzyme